MRMRKREGVPKIVVEGVLGRFDWTPATIQSRRLAALVVRW
jgi:hypothetical protein